MLRQNITCPECCVTDSRLTTHGLLQTQRLAQHLVRERALAFSHIFSSDLSRARITADAIQDAQTNHQANKVRVERSALELLREQDFGSLECQPWASKPNGKTPTAKLLDPHHPDFRLKETAESMAERANRFLDEFIYPILAQQTGSEKTVAVVSHGIILSVIWKCLLRRFGPGTVSVSPEVTSNAGNRPLEYLPSWTNTGYLELAFRPNILGLGLTETRPTAPILTSPMFTGYQMHIKIVNCKQHLHNLKRTRGGLGSSAVDSKQKNLDGFFKKTKVEGHDKKSA